MRKSIPTLYNGIQFRSRLEATWAAFFDVIGWEWEYEPALFEGPGWTPDFLLKGRNTLVEVKPEIDPSEWSDMEAVEYAFKRPVPEGFLLMFVGVFPVPGLLIAADPEPGEPEYADPSGDRSVATLILGRGYVVDQDLGIDKPCHVIATISIHPGLQMEWDYTIAPIDAPVAGSAESALIACAAGRFPEAWAMAKNAVQWRPPA
jgi:hypothetical protein